MSVAPIAAEAPPAPWRRLPTMLLGGLFALLLLVAATGGPDCLQYLDWSRAARTADIGELPGDLRSPAGLPLTQWSHGPGLYFSLPYLSPTRHLVSDGPFAPVRDFRFMGWLAALALWCGLFGAVRRLTRHDTPAVTFALAIAFAGTHLGFYSFVHSSEILSFGCLALIVYRLCVARALGAWDLLGLGALCGTLVLIRPHLALYLPLILGVTAWRLARQSSANRWLNRAVQGLLVAAPILFAVVQVTWVNRWMTGSPLRSPYSFGDAGFRSLDLARPELLAVLVHPWHGLLTYHPLYALSFALAVAGIFRGSRPARLLHLGVAVTLLVHLYIQAAWYCWWLGLWSLGNRGLGVAAVLLVPVLAHALREASPRRRVALAAGAMICALWSALLMIQGHTNFAGWTEVLAAQATALLNLSPMLPVILLAPLVAYALARDRGRAGRLLAAGAALLLALVLDHLALRATEVVAGATRGAWPFVFRVCFVALAPLTARLDLSRPRSRTGGSSDASDRPWQPAAVAAVAIAPFLWTGALFLRLASGTERMIAMGGVPPRGPVTTFQVDEVQACQDEYLAVPGFEDKKLALRGFLERHDPR